MDIISNNAIPSKTAWSKEIWDKRQRWLFSRWISKFNCDVREYGIKNIENNLGSYILDWCHDVLWVIAGKYVDGLSVKRIHSKLQRTTEIIGYTDPRGIRSAPSVLSGFWDPFVDVFSWDPFRWAPFLCFIICLSFVFLISFFLYSWRDDQNIFLFLSFFIPSLVFFRAATFSSVRALLSSASTFLFYHTIYFASTVT